MTAPQLQTNSMTPDSAALDDMDRGIVPFAGVRLHLETDKVVVWEEHFPPREATEPHRHTRDYISIALTDIDLSFEIMPGENAEQLEVLLDKETCAIGNSRSGFRKGTVFHSRVSNAGAAHTAFNNLHETSKLLIIELKGTGLESKA